MQFEYINYTRAAQKTLNFIIHKDGEIKISNHKSTNEFWIHIYCPPDLAGDIQTIKIHFDNHREMTTALCGFNNLLNQKVLPCEK